MRASFLILFSFSFSASVLAQDTTGKKGVNISATFKPTLREAAKINFNATPPQPDTTRPRLQYSIPNQNLNFAFQPGSLKPLALEADSAKPWSNESYVKLGYGNFKTPFAQAGISFGDGRTAGLNLYIKHVSSQGNIPFQDFSNSSVDLNGFFKGGENGEWNVRFGGLREQYNRYGFEPKTLQFPDDSIGIRYQTWRGRVSYRNLNKNELGISYAPEIRISNFGDDLKNSERNLYANLPLQKSIGQNFSVDLALTANLSRYNKEGKDAINNNWFALAPSFNFRKSNVGLQAGIRPSWDNGEFKLFPNVMMEFTPKQLDFSFQVGWTGYMRNSGFQYQAAFNPWIWAPERVDNTWIEERYAGIKGTVGDRKSVV